MARLCLFNLITNLSVLYQYFLKSYQVHSSFGVSSFFPVFFFSVQGGRTSDELIHTERLGIFRDQLKCDVM